MPNDMTRIEIITGRERRRRYTAEHKLRLVEQTMQPGMTVSAVARLHGVSPSLLFKLPCRQAAPGRPATHVHGVRQATSRARADTSPSA